ncbi:MAG: hypothetical protein ACK5Q5_22950 [Planctomycetaceae bacterium]
MVSWLNLTGLCVCLAWCGCSQSNEELRTYSVETDGTAEQTATSETDVATNDGPAGVEKPTVEPEPAPDNTVVAAVEPAAIPDQDVTASVAAQPRPPRVPLPELRVSGPASASETSLTGAATAGEARDIKLLVPEKDFARIDGGQRLRVSFDDLDLLKVLNMDPVAANCMDYFPNWLKSLDGQQIRLRGFMIPQTRSDGITGFQLARDTQLCCFGRNPKPYDVIPVLLKEGTTTHYIHLRPFDVVGRFAIRPYSFRGEIENLYEIEEAELIER